MQARSRSRRRPARPGARAVGVTIAALVGGTLLFLGLDYLGFVANCRFDSCPDRLWFAALGGRIAAHLYWWVGSVVIVFIVLRRLDRWLREPP